MCFCKDDRASPKLPNRLVARRVNILKKNENIADRPFHRFGKLAKPQEV